MPGTGIQLGRTFQVKGMTPEPEPSPSPEPTPEPVVNRKKKRRRRKRKKNLDQNSEFFTEDISRQPALITTIRLASGVSLTEGNQEKHGLQDLGDPKHMSLADFKEHQRDLEENPKGGKPEDEYTMGSTQLSDINYEEFDLTSGARRRGHGKEQSEPPEYYDPNQELINSTDWGSSNPNPHAYEPPLRPERVKDVLKRYEHTVGRLVKKPKDRPYSRQSTEASPEKLMLPPITVSDMGRKLKEDPKYYRRTRYEQTFGAKKKGNLRMENEKALHDMFPNDDFDTTREVQL